MTNLKKLLTLLYQFDNFFSATLCALLQLHLNRFQDDSSLALLFQKYFYLHYHWILKSFKTTLFATYDSDYLKRTLHLHYYSLIFKSVLLQFYKFCTITTRLFACTTNTRFQNDFSIALQVLHFHNNVVFALLLDRFFLLEFDNLVTLLLLNFDNNALFVLLLLEFDRFH